MTPEQTAAASRATVDELGAAFCQCPTTLRRARQLGLTGWAFHVAGRAGVLGDVAPEVVTAALGFIAAEAVRDGWEAAARVAPPSTIAGYRLSECCRWGRERLIGMPDVARLADLAGRIVDAADPAGMPLFAAWRAAPLPERSPGARVAAAVKTLRELREGAQLLAVRAAGLTPLEAVLASPEGEAGAIGYGWSPPFPPRAALLRRLIWADALADRIAGRAYAVLTVPERDEFIALLRDATSRIPGRVDPASRR